MPSDIIHDIKGKDARFAVLWGWGFRGDTHRFFCVYGNGMGVYRNPISTAVPLVLVGVNTGATETIASRGFRLLLHEVFSNYARSKIPNCNCNCVTSGNCNCN